MVQPKYNKGIAVDADSLERQLKSIDNLIEKGMLVVDMLQGTAAMNSHVWNYYMQNDKMTHGFCIMLRSWINFQRSWKKGELLQMTEDGSFNRIAEDEIEMLAKQAKHPSVMTGRVSPSVLRTDKLSDDKSDEQKRMYLKEYITNRYCLWPDAAPILLVCIGVEGKAIATLEQTTVPSQLNYQWHE